MQTGILTWAAFLFWAVSEVFIRVQNIIKRKSISKKQRQDRGSYLLVSFGIYLCIFICVYFSFHRWGWVNQIIADLGALFMFLGTAFRIWSVQVLGRNFSPIVTVDAEQTLVTTGPYHLIRHPAYSGLFLTFVSMGIAFHSWLASCVILILISQILRYRILVEENALKEKFGQEYEDYCHKTWRLIPYVW